MGDSAMALGEAELLRIGDYVKGNLKAWLQEVAPTVFTPDPVSNTQLLERLVRLEERFEHVDERFERVDDRFVTMDKRFDDLIHYMDRRFEATLATLQQIGKRIGTVQWMVLAGLAAIAVGATLLVGFFG
ncbi:MAG: hypothetical protein V3S41_00125 [Spirochaetia bacterium]